MSKSIGVAYQAAALADVTAYTAHSAGATPVTSDGATDLDTTAAQVALVTTKLNALLAALRDAKVIGA